MFWLVKTVLVCFIEQKSHGKTKFTLIWLWELKRFKRLWPEEWAWK